LAENQPARETVQVTYTNPETGGDSQNILGYYAQMLRPGQSLRLPIRSPAMVCHLIEGAVEVTIDDQSYRLDEADTCCAPGFAEVSMRNLLTDAATYLFLADEAPLHRKLGVFENRG
ncbi:MAG: cupin, partial [Burkholderiaceae bacterium]